MSWYAILAIVGAYFGIGMGLLCAVEDETGPMPLLIQQAIVIAIWPLLVVAKLSYIIFSRP